MKNRIQDFGTDGTPILFSHANGFPPGSYHQLFKQLAPEYRVRAISHRPLWERLPPKQEVRWQTYVDDLIETLDHIATPAWIIGHSMGASISLLAADQRPELFRGLVLLDPVLMRKRISLLIHATPRQLQNRMPYIKRTLQRPDTWTSKKAAFDFHRPKRSYQKLNDAALWDYIEHGTMIRDDNLVELCFPKHWEANIYRNVPNIWNALKKVEVPIYAIKGADSDIVTPAFWQRWKHAKPNSKLGEVANGSHLFPLEYPEATAAFIKQFIADH